MQPIFRSNELINSGIYGSRDSGADIFNRGLCLPSDNKMTADQQEIIMNLIRGCFEQAEMI